MKKNIITKVLSIVLVCVMLITSMGAYSGNEDKVLIPTDKSNEFYLTQSESVDLYNYMLDAFTVERDNSNINTFSSESNNRKVEYPDYYGGSYIDSNTGKLVVLVKKEDFARNSNNIKKLFNNHKNIRLKPTKYSYNEYDEAIKEIASSASLLLEQGIIIDAVKDDIRNERIIVQVKELTSEKEKQLRSMFKYKFMHIQEGEQIVPNVSIGGGFAGECMNSIATISFAATRNGTDGYVVSGHHVRNKMNADYYYGNTKIGTVTAQAFSGNTTADAAFVTANSNASPSGNLANGGHIWSVRNAVPVGTIIHMYGISSGLTSGEVLGNNGSITLEGHPGIYLDNMYYGNYAAKGGDSGAPILFYDGHFGNISRYSIVGSHSGGGETSGLSYFSSYGNIASELNITAKTNYEE